MSRGRDHDDAFLRNRIVAAALPLPKHDGGHARRLFPTKLLTRPESAWFPAPMTQRNNPSQAIVATQTGVPLPLRLIAAAALVLVLVLITVPTGAGIGFA